MRCHSVLSRGPPSPLSAEIGPPADRELPETDVLFDTSATIVISHRSRETECSSCAGAIVLEDVTVTGASKLAFDLYFAKNNLKIYPGVNWGCSIFTEK